MSRTDVHAPVHVQIARGDMSSQPCHASGHAACDLPPVEKTEPSERQTTGCFWGFIYTGVNECPCASCHGGWTARARNRAERHRDRAALGTALDVWRGGDRTAFDDIVPPDRRR